MTYRINALDNGILEVVHTDELTMQEAVESRQRSGEEMADRGLARVLVDMSAAIIRQVPDTMALYEFNISYYDAFPAGSFIACVIEPQKNIADEASFAETVALNRGISLRIFTERNAAIAWLQGLQDE